MALFRSLARSSLFGVFKPVSLAPEVEFAWKIRRRLSWGGREGSVV